MFKSVAKREDSDQRNLMRVKQICGGQFELGNLIFAWRD
jgi:hypothetical protein